MASSSNGNGLGPPKLSQRLSEYFLRPAKLKAAGAGAAAPPDRILEPHERRAAMSGLDPVEIKWTKGGLLLASMVGVFLTIYLAADHPTRTQTVVHHGKKVKEIVPISDSWLLLGGIVLLFCLLGYVAMRRQRRSLVVFTFFVTGFSFTLIFAPLGFALILLGGWLLLRAYRIQKYGTANSKQVSKQAAARPPRRDRKRAAVEATKPAARKAPTASKRYTPKAPPRKKVAKPAP
jgi:hypothetical protein